MQSEPPQEVAANAPITKGLDYPPYSIPLGETTLIHFHSPNDFILTGKEIVL